MVSTMSNTDASAHLIKHKVRTTGDWITIAIPAALSSEADPMSRRSQGRLSHVSLDANGGWGDGGVYREKATGSASELYLNSK